MDWITTTWQAIEPYVMKVIDLLVNSGIGAAIGLLVVKKWEKKHNEAQLSESIATSVSKSMVGKNVLVSLESVNKEQMKNVVAIIQNSLDKSFEIVKEQANVVASMGKIMLKFKAATDEEKQELLTALNNIEKVTNTKLTVIAEEKPIVVEVEKVEEKQNTETEISLF